MTASVLHIVQHLQPGGLETLVLEIQAHDPECHIVSLEGAMDETVRNWPRLEKVKSKLHFLNKPAGIDLGTIKRLTRLIRDLAPAVVHTHHIGPLLYGGLAARFANCDTLVHTEHDAWHLEGAKRAQLMRWCTKILAPRVVADADAVAEQLLARCGVASTTIRNGIDTDKFNPSPKNDARAAFDLPMDWIVVGTAGRMEPVKNQALLLRAFAKLDQGLPIALALAGDGSCRKDLETLAEHLGISSKVHFLGLVDRMPEYLSALDLFVLPSDKEGYPLSLLEAQSCGTPVIATDVGGARDAVCNRTGRLIKAKDETALSAAIRGFLALGERRNPRHFVVRNGSLEAMIKNYRGIYDL